MNDDLKIRDAQNRLIETYTKHPEEALSTVRANARIESGMTCVFTQGEHQLVMDAPESTGGDDEGPEPGLFARASITGCAAMNIKQLAALKGIPIKSVSVDIEMDFDNAAMLGLGKASAAPLETRLAVQIESEVDQAQLSVLVDEALERDTYFLALRDSQQIKLTVASHREG